MIVKIRGIYNKLNIGIKASIWFMFCNIIQKGITMLTVPIFTRLLSTEEYGIYSVYPVMVFNIDHYYHFIFIWWFL